MKSFVRLSALLLSACILLAPVGLFAQASKGIALSLGTMRTSLEEIAMHYAVEYSKSINDIFYSSFKNTDDSWLVALSPSVMIETGGNDAFDGATVKLNGHFIFFDVVTIEDIPVPNTASLFHVIPIAAAIETDRSIANVAALVELGYVPWYQNIKSLSEFFKQSKVGIFVQAGYKVKADPRVSSSEAGNVNESREAAESGLARVKGSLGLKLYETTLQGIKISLAGNADGWLDILNEDFYYKAEATIIASISTNYNIDFKYQKGSGAPLFNSGDQFSANIVMQY